jgi:hypothetical protein
MSQRNVLVFECLTFGAPEWHEASEGVRLGQLIAQAIAAALTREGRCSVDPVEAHGSYGWEFDACHGGTRVRCLLQRSDAWLLITEPRRPLADRLNHQPFEPDHASICEALDAAVRRIPGVTDIGWMTLEEFRAGPSGPTGVTR